MSWTGEIEPASLDQIRAGREGKMVTIDNDVSNVAADLKRIDPRLCLRWSEAGGYFVVYIREPGQREGSGHLVGTFQELDQRIVKSIEKTVHKWTQPGFSFADETDKAEAAARARVDYETSQKVAESAERLAHALRQDLGYTGHRAFIGAGLDD